LLILQGNSCSITQKSGGIWTVQTDLQQIYPKSDRLLELQTFLFVDVRRKIHLSLAATLATSEIFNPFMEIVLNDYFQVLRQLLVSLLVVPGKFSYLEMNVGPG